MAKPPVKIIKKKIGRDAVKSFSPDNLRIDQKKGHPPLIRGGESGWQRVGGGGSGPTTTTTTTTTRTT